MHSAVMSAGVAKTGEPRLIANGAHTHRRSAKFFRLSQLRKLRGCEQVAAVCYRVRSSGIEFLLVRTGSGHWTFPKGSAEPGLTHAQAAALEAFEEAGVHGRMEEASFTRYIRRKGGRTRNSARSGERSAVKEIAIQAHLCEVSRLDPPQERNRNPTWFSADKAKRRLREDRTPDFGAELARVVDRAVTRIRRLRSETITMKDRPQKDALQKVQFIDRIPTAADRTKALKTG
jgi:8-oxo-dGTP pyrophosphatase MutT (NUDIX family)